MISSKNCSIITNYVCNNGDIHSSLKRRSRKMSYKIYLTLYTLTSSVLCLNGPGVYQVTEPMDHAEGPTWDCRTGLLYFVDIFVGKVLSYNSTTNEVNAIYLSGNVTPVIPSLHNPYNFLVGVDRSLVAIEWDGQGGVTALRNLTTVSPQFPTSRFNDGKADKKGRLWFGTMGFEISLGISPYEGILYRFTKCNLANPMPVIYPVRVSNGLAWNRANNKFYYIDTPTLVVREYDFDHNSGAISNPRIVFDLRKHETIGGFPDGMTIDIDDNLWIALYSGGAVIKVNPRTGCVLQVIAIPARFVTSLCWGGPNLDILYVTTSRNLLTALERIQQPAAGSVFVVTDLGTRGLPAFNADIIDSVV